MWKDVIGFEAIYQVSNTGLVRVLPRIRRNGHGKVIYKGKILKAAISNGYLHVGLTKNSICSVIHIHKLVGIHFVKGHKEGLEINHKDGNKLNNHFSNLEWVTHRQNQRHAVNNGLMPIGTNHPKSKLSNALVLEIKSLYYGKTNYKEVGIKYGIPRMVAYGIMSGRFYKTINQQSQPVNQ